MSDFQSTPDIRAAQAIMLTLTTAGALINILLLAAGIRSSQIRQKAFHSLMLVMCCCDTVMLITACTSLSISLYTGTTPDARPWMCHVQGVISTVSCAMSLWILTAAALSRYLVIVKQRYPTRRQYIYMIIICATIALFTCAPLMANRVAVANNGGGLLCAPAWSGVSDARHLYVIVVLIAAGSIAIAISCWSFHRSFKHIRTIKTSVSESTATQWSESTELHQLKRLFTVTAMLGVFWMPLGVEVWIAAITQEPVAPELDQTGLIMIAIFALYYPCGMWLSSQPIRNAVLELLRLHKVTAQQPHPEVNQFSTDPDTPRGNPPLERKNSIVPGAGRVHSRLLSSTPRISPLHFDGRLNRTYSTTQDLSVQSLSPRFLTASMPIQPNFASTKSTSWGASSTDSNGVDYSLRHLSVLQSQPRLDITPTPHPRKLSLQLPTASSPTYSLTPQLRSGPLHYPTALFIDAVTAADAAADSAMAQSRRTSSTKVPSNPLPPPHPRSSADSYA